jgi:hypothetical protein
VIPTPRWAAIASPNATKYNVRGQGGSIKAKNEGIDDEDDPANDHTPNDGRGRLIVFCTTHSVRQAEIKPKVQGKMTHDQAHHLVEL